MRGPLSSKSGTCTESMGVDAAGISAKVGTHYPGRSVGLLHATTAEKWLDGAAKVSRTHSRSFDRTEGPNMKYWMGDLSLDGDRRRRQYG